MSQQDLLDEAAFQYLARQAGLPADATHLADLLRYVRNALAPLQSVRNIEVAGAEPDLAFIPRLGEK